MSDADTEIPADDEVSPDEPGEIVVDEDEETQVLDVDSDAEVIPLRYSVTSYGADFSVDVLIQRLKERDIRIPRFGEAQPTSKLGVKGFQRGKVWSKRQKDRFIESLILGLPVPEIFLVAEPDGVYLVLDGQQRLSALQDYFDGVTAGREFKLQYAQKDIRLTYKELTDEDRRRLRNAIVHATIVRQDMPEDGQSAIYTLFERINTGGTSLQPQEIRVALFHGAFVDLIAQLNADTAWRSLYGSPSARLKDQELILRFFALYYRDLNDERAYRRPMKEFLNSFLGWNRHLAEVSETDLRSLFTGATTAVLDGLGSAAFKRSSNQVNAAVFDSVMIGVAARIQRGPISDLAQLRAAYDNLFADKAYVDATFKATADVTAVRDRIAAATTAFASVP